MLCLFGTVPSLALCRKSTLAIADTHGVKFLHQPFGFGMWFQ